MGIEGVIYQQRGVEHEDARRALLVGFNGDLDLESVGFSGRPAQAKYLIPRQDRVVLGGHFHEYKEMFFIPEGEAEFTLLDKETGQTEVYNLTQGDRLIIPERVPHKAVVSRGTLLVGYTEEEYVSPQHNDHKYDF